MRRKKYSRFYGLGIWPEVSGGNKYDGGGPLRTSDLTPEQQDVMSYIQAEPEVLFTPQYSKWRGYIKRTQPEYFDWLFESLPQERQDFINSHYPKAFGVLSDGAKGRYGERVTRKAMNDAGAYAAAGLGATMAAPYLIGGLAMNPYSLHTVTAAGAAFVNDMVEEQTPKLNEQHYPSMHSEPHNDFLGTAHLVHSNPDIYEWDTGKIALFQSLVGLPKTGIIDIPTLAQHYRIKTNNYSDGGSTEQPKEEPNIAIENIKRFLCNLAKNPYLAYNDAILWEADRLGLPSNAMNFIRDAVNGGAYRFYAAIASVFKTVSNGNFSNVQSFADGFKTNFEHYKKEPSLLQKSMSINPLINDNDNYSEEELDALSRMIDKNNNITTKSIEALGEGYGHNDKVWNHFTPTRVVSESIGRANVRDGYITDIFDYNVGDAYSDAVHNAYTRRMKENGPNFDYNTVRYIGQNVGMTSDIPDEYKIKTSIRVNPDGYNWLTHSGTIKTEDEFSDYLNHINK